MIVTSFSYDKSARPPTLLKQSPPHIFLIDPVHKFQNSCFKEHPWKAATVLKTSMEHATKYACDSIFHKAPPLKNIETLNESVFATGFLNFV